MLFRKKLPRACEYCRFGTNLNEEEFLCIKKGVVPKDKACRKFKYDPCKRIPLKAKAASFSDYKPEDFDL